MAILSVLLVAQILFNLVICPLRRSLPRLMGLWRFWATASVLKLLLYCFVPTCFFCVVVLNLITFFFSGRTISLSELIGFYPVLLRLTAFVAGISFLPYLVPKLRKILIKNPQIIDSLQALLIARLMVELVFINLKPQSLVPPEASFYEYICFIANYEKLLLSGWTVLVVLCFSFMIDRFIAKVLKKVFVRKKLRRFRFLSVVITQLVAVIIFLDVSIGRLQKADYKYGDFFNETPTVAVVYKVFLFRNVIFYIDGMADFGYFLIKSLSDHPCEPQGSLRRFNSTDFTPLD